MKLERVLAAKGPKVVTVDSNALVAEAVARLASHNIGALVVVDSALAPIGILSERDIVRALDRRPGATSGTVSDLMTSPVVTATSQDDVESVLRTMTTGRFRHVPVVDDGALVGIVTIGDLVKAQLNEYQGAVVTLETRIMTTSEAAAPKRRQN